MGEAGLRPGLSLVSVLHKHFTVGPDFPALWELPRNEWESALTVTHMAASDFQTATLHWSGLLYQMPHQPRGLCDTLEGRNKGILPLQ